MYHLSHDQAPKKQIKDTPPVLSIIALVIIGGAGFFFIAKLFSLFMAAILR